MLPDRPPGRRTEPEVTTPQARLNVENPDDTDLAIMPPADDAAAMLRRRRQAALRLPPLAAGRRDPLDARAGLPVPLARDWALITRCGMTGHDYRPDATGFACETCGQPAGSCTAVLRTAEQPAAHVPAGPSRANEHDGADPLPDEPWSELGYARRLVAVYGGRLRYVPAWRRWLVWDGQRWAQDMTGQSARWMKAIARRLTADAIALADGPERKALLNLARRGESAAGIAGALTLAGTEQGVVVTPDDLDADPFLLNCANGVLDLRTGILGKHDPKLMLTKMTGAAYRPDAAGPEFAKFLERVQPDPAMRDYLARLLGHALEGRVVSHILPIFHGAGANGKGTLTGAVLATLGDYADAADPELLTARTFDAHPTGTADLYGLRVAVLHESDHGRRLAEGTVKRLTGGDRLEARRMREDFWSFEPSHTFLMLTNHKPVIGGTDEGIWRRLRLVPWDVVIPPEDRDEELGDRLALELDAVLAWLAEGYRDWHARGLADPDAVTQATDAYRAESDVLSRFVADRCLTGPHFRIRSSELFAAWSRWCGAEGEEPGTQTGFSIALVNRGLGKKSTNVGMVWQGIGLAGEDDD
ncbi:MAG TPA: phage/plasmid primase, P4 family [Streptosporangiaceae bacterium]|nr:phage/plasmid primase, P4 family [Streptosporangiaceae bacterium]